MNHCWDEKKTLYAVVHPNNSILIYDTKSGDVINELKLTLQEKVNFSCIKLFSQKVNIIIIIIENYVKEKKIRNNQKILGMWNNEGYFSVFNKKGIIIIWDVDSGELIKKIESETKSKIMLEFINQDTLLIASGKKELFTWTFPDGDKKRIIKTEINSIKGLCKLNDLEYLVSTSSEVLIFKQGNLTKKLQGHLNGSHTFLVYEKYLVTGSNDNYIYIFDLESKSEEPIQSKNVK
jgi:WD40 repeat protein